MTAVQEMTEVREITSGLRYPEGPVAMADGGVIVCELESAQITRVAPDGSKEVIAKPGGSPNGAQIGPDGKLYVANNGRAWDFREIGDILLTSQPPTNHEGGRIERIDLETGEVEVLYDSVDGRPLIAPDDLVFDDQGGFWFTDTGIRYERNADRTFLVYAKADGSEIRETIAGPLDAPNGVGLSPSQDRLYVSETFSAGMWAFDLIGPGEIKPQESLVNNNATFIVKLAGFTGFDSLAVEADGNVCIATLGSGGITVVTPEGELIEFVQTGDILTSNIAFGGEDMRTAYITAAATGKLLAAEWPRPGLKLAYQQVGSSQ